MAMSIRMSLLAILAQGPCYGHQLRAEFDRRTGGTWPVNVGQIYTTLDRLVRDKLAADAGPDAEGRQTYAITDAGRAAVEAWITAPVPPPRDEFAVKLALAASLPGVDAAALVTAQRELLAAEAGLPASDPVRALLSEARASAARAEAAWLERALEASRAIHPHGLAAETPKRGRPRTAE